MGFLAVDIMKYITEKDDKWHPMNEEMPPRTVDVELKDKDGTITKATIVAEMSGYYLYMNPGWGSLSDYTHWRFTENSIL